VKQGPNYIQKQYFLVGGVRLSQIGFVATGALCTLMWLTPGVAHSTGALRFTSLTDAVSVRMRRSSSNAIPFSTSVNVRFHWPVGGGERVAE
jgi:hypothetical protein